MDDLTAFTAQEDVNERVIDIVRSELERLTKRMSELGMTAEYDITEQYEVVTFTITVMRGQKKIAAVARAINASLMTGRSHAVATVERELENALRVIFFVE